MAQDPGPSAAPFSLFVAETPRAAAEVVGCTPGDIRFMDHEQFDHAPDDFDLTPFSQVFVGVGAGQASSVFSLLRRLVEQHSATPDVTLELEPEFGPERLAFLAELNARLADLERVRAGAGQTTGSLQLRATPASTESDALVRAWAAAREVRASLELAEATRTWEPSPNPADGLLTDTGPHAGELARLREQLQAKEKQVAGLGVRVARLRARAERRAQRIEAQAQRIREVEAYLRDVPRVTQLMIRSTGLDRARMMVRRVGPEWRSRFRAALPLVGAGMVLGAASLGWVSPLGAFGALLGVVAVVTAGLIALLVAYIVGLRTADFARDRRFDTFVRRHDRLGRSSKALTKKMLRSTEEADRRIRSGTAEIAQSAADITEQVRSVADSVMAVAAEGSERGAALDARTAALAETAADISEQVRSVADSASAAAANSEKIVASASAPATAPALSAFEQRMNAARLRQTQHLEATIGLFSMTEVDAVVPAMGGWAASADLIRFLLGEMTDLRPSTIVECGSGVSTLWFALTARRLGLDCRIVALEHDPIFRDKTNAVLRDHGVADLAEVRLAPLQDLSVRDQTIQWYDTAATDDLRDIGLLFVDGPPNASGPLARYPAVPVMKEKFAPKSVVVLDDLVRDEERAVANMWQEDLPDFTYELLNLEKGAGVFRRGDGR